MGLRHELTDAQWEAIRQLLPPERGRVNKHFEPAGGQRYPLGTSNGRAVARPTRAVSGVEWCLCTLSSVESEGALGAVVAAAGTQLR